MYEPQISTAEQIARGVAAAKGGAVRRTGTGYECRCPAHDDHDPSLSVSDGQNGPLVHCHAGCSQESVIGALRDLGLWHTKPRAKVEPMRPKGIPSAWHGKPLSILYTYATQSGEIVGYVARYEDPAGKEPIPFFQREGDRWKAGAQADPRTLYGLPSLAKPGPVYVVEGEKAADSMIRRGHACVTNQGGSKAAKKADCSPLAGRDVILWPDYDAPGVQHAKDCRAMLRGIASSVRMVDVQAMDPDEAGWDAADWDGVGNIPLADESTKPSAPAPVPREYRKRDSGAMKPISYNIHVLLSGLDCLGWDLLSDRPVWRQKPPFISENRLEIHDQDAVELAFFASDMLGADFKTAQALEAIEVTAKRNPFHPVQDYLRGLSWDGTPRLDSWMSDVFGVSETPYHAAVGAKFLIAAVARAMRPGCQMDTMLVLMGGQGIGKTTAVRDLLPEFSWYSETTESPANKDFYQALRGKWIVEIGELHSFKNADWTKIKQMLSARSDTYRASYAHFAKDYQRQCVFIGTTNDETWNRDSTGARRFWPVRCMEVNKDYLRAQRDQLWAEAMLRLDRGEDWWTVPDCEEHQDSVYQEDVWDSFLTDWILSRTQDSFTIGDILGEALNIERGMQKTSDEMRVGHLLRRLKFKRTRIMVNGTRKYVYQRPK